MDIHLDPLEKEAFRELAVHKAHLDARAVITKVLDRQSLTEIPVDYSRGLKDALKLAKDCKVHFHRHSSMTKADSEHDSLQG